nr:MAG TPA: hypothetical protein [Caudoviricetes sp.]
MTPNQSYRIIVALSKQSAQGAENDQDQETHNQPSDR